MPTHLRQVVGGRSWPKSNPTGPGSGLAISASGSPLSNWLRHAAVLGSRPALFPAAGAGFGQVLAHGVKLGLALGLAASGAHLGKVVVQDSTGIGDRGHKTGERFVILSSNLSRFVLTGQGVAGSNSL